MGDGREELLKESAVLYPAARELLHVRTVEVLQLHDPVQQRNVNFRLHIPEKYDGAMPVVIFSHGSLCSPKMYDPVATGWAARGYMVVLPEHSDAPESPAATQPPDLRKLLSSRIRDMSFALEALAQIAGVAGATVSIDTARMAAAGHSFGSLTALIKVGLALKPGEYSFAEATADERFRAAISMSGVGPLPPFADDAFRHLTGPLIATGGTLDLGNLGAGPVLPWEWRMSPYTLAPPGDKYSLVLDNADHYFGGLIGNAEMGGPADPGGLAIVLAATAAFLDAHVCDGRAALEWLQGADLDALTRGRAKFERK
jgi:hypothetical protein